MYCSSLAIRLVFQMSCMAGRTAFSLMAHREELLQYIAASAKIVPLQLRPSPWCDFGLCLHGALLRPRCLQQAGKCDSDDALLPCSWLLHPASVPGSIVHDGSMGLAKETVRAGLG